MAMSELPNKFMSILSHPFNNSLISCVHSFTESDLSDTDNIVPFKNSTPINLIDLLCVRLFWPFYTYFD